MDYYSILNVPKHASQEDIKSSFRRLAMKYHPDRNQNNPEAEENFKKIKEAYDVLSDPKKRADYDNPQPDFSNFNGVPPDIEEIIRNFGGFGFSRQRPPPKNRNYNVQIVVSLQEILNGKEVVGTIDLPSGGEPLNLKIPKGVRHGDNIKFPNLGDNSISNLPRGDLVVTVIEQTDLKFKRNGSNVITEIPVSVLSLLTGDTVSITNFDGKVLQFKIPPGTGADKTFACTGQGLPITINSEERGDLLVKLKVTIPCLSEDDILTLKSIKSKYE